MKKTRLISKKMNRLIPPFRVGVLVPVLCYLQTVVLGGLCVVLQAPLWLSLIPLMVVTLSDVCYIAVERPAYVMSPLFVVPVLMSRWFRRS